MLFVLLILWGSLFWPITLGCEYFWVKALERASFLTSGNGAVLFMFWAASLSYLFETYRRSIGLADGGSSTEKVLYIVEAPNAAQAARADATYLECEKELQEPPTVGERVILNSENGVIVGIVEEVLDAPADANERWWTWFRLERPDDFETLNESSDWFEEEGVDKRRTTRLPTHPQPVRA